MNKYIVTAMLAGLLSGCDAFQSSSQTLQQTDKTGLERETDPAVIVAGASLYQRHCAACHGDNAEGDADWRQRDAEGKFPPPPLNGAGHAWHHSTQRLVEMVAEGTEPQGKMPGWQGKLSQKEIESIVAWLQAQWSDLVYDTWRERQQAKLKR